MDNLLRTMQTPTRQLTAHRSALRDSYTHVSQRHAKEREEATGHTLLLIDCTQPFSLQRQASDLRPAEPVCLAIRLPVHAVHMRTLLPHRTPGPP